MGFYLKDKVVVEAHRLPPESEDASEELIEFLHDADAMSDYDGGISIFTPDETLRGDPGDWIIKGPDGKFYPCKPDVFDKICTPLSRSTARRLSATVNS